MSVLENIAADFQSNSALKEKKHIQSAAGRFPHAPMVNGSPVLVGDDTAAIELNGEYLLFAAEGVWPPLLEKNPVLAGRSCVIANVNDIYAMGGRPLAVTDVLLHDDIEKAGLVLQGIQENAERFRVPVVGGHSTLTEDVASLSVSIVGRAKKILSSYTAEKGDYLMMAGSYDGRFRDGFDFWDSCSQLSGDELLEHLEIMPYIAEEGLCNTAKDISMAGLLGTLVMLLETSCKGADLVLEAVPKPEGADLCRWLRAFHSFGFILSVRPQHVKAVEKAFEDKGLFCKAFGTVNNSRKLTISYEDEMKVLWDAETLTGFGGREVR